MNQKIWDQYIEKAGETGLTNIVVSQSGKRIAEHHYLGEHRRNIYSATKSFTSTAVGIAVKEGLLSLDEKVVDCFPDKVPDQPSEYLQHLTVYHLLNMTVGQSQSHLMGEYRPSMKEKDWVHYVLHQPFDWEPGTQFLYSNTGPYLAGMLVAKRAGCTMADYLQARVFDHLGWNRVTWEVDPLGNTFGAGGLFLTTTELLQFGELYLNDGYYNGRQLVPTEWVRRVEQVQIQVPEKEQGYSHLFWHREHGSYCASGKYGQYSIIMKDKNAVMACEAESSRGGSFIRPFWEMVYPEL